MLLTLIINCCMLDFRMVIMNKSIVQKNKLKPNAKNRLLLVGEALFVS